MFSRRTAWTRSTNRLSALAEAARAAGRDVFDLTETNPTRAGLRAPEDVLRPLADAGALEYDPSPFGLAEARAAVAADFGRRGVAVAAERVVLTASTSEAYAYLFKLLCDPGDAVLVPHPSYPLFEYLAELESVRVVPYPLRYDGAWHLQVDALARTIPAHARAVVVVSPNNPTGSFVKTDEAAALRALCAERGLAVVSDEVFADYTFGDDARRAATLLSDGGPLTFSLGGLSKSCGLPQLKLGWMAVGGPEAEREEALARLEIVADTYLSVGTPVQRAAPALLRRLPELQAPIRERVRSNRDTLAGALGDTPATLLHVEGGWTAVLHVPATRTEEDWVARLLEQDAVLVHPGFYFDFPQEAYLVVSLLPPPARFETAVGRLAARIADDAY